MGNDKRFPARPDDNAPELDVDDPSFGLDAPEPQEVPGADRKRGRKDSIELVPSLPGSFPRFDAPPPEPPPATSASPDVRDMRDRYATGDFSGALTVAQDILRRQPHDGEAQRCAHSCQKILSQMYAARLGPFERAPRVALSREEVRWLSLDHRTGFVLSLVDGISTIDQILDLSGMPRLEALRILHALLEQRVIAVGTRS